jgi:hypothetical protein
MGTQKTYALVLGIVALVIGIWGFFTSSILNIFGVNALQSVVHVIAGIFGIYVGTKGEGPGFNGSLGWVSLVLAILGFVASGFMASFLGVNTATTWLHLVVGVVSLIVFYGAE